MVEGTKITVYVRGGDLSLLEEARKMTEGSEDSLSSMLFEGLRIVVARRQREAETVAGMSVITLEGVDGGDTDKPRKLRFTGRLVAKQRDDAVYLTKAGKVVTEVDGRDGIELMVFDDVEEFITACADSFDGSTLTEVAEAAGSEYVEEID